jgi:hypothetical protein
VSHYAWTEEDVAAAKRRAALSRMRAESAGHEARQIEHDFWKTKLENMFPELQHCGENREYLARIQFSGEEEACMCRGPVADTYRGVVMFVWHKTTKGRLRKLATVYQCSEIVPFIKTVKLLQGK